EAEFERDIDLTMRTVLGRGISESSHLHIQAGKGFLGNLDPTRPLPGWLSEADIKYFADAYRKSGFRGGLNWYRNLDRNWDLTAAWHDAKIMQPALFIAGANDAVITGSMGKRALDEMSEVVPNLERKLVLEGAGHWIQQERPAEVN